MAQTISWLFFMGLREAGTTRDAEISMGPLAAATRALANQFSGINKFKSSRGPTRARVSQWFDRVASRGVPRWRKSDGQKRWARTRALARAQDLNSKLID